MRGRTLTQYNTVLGSFIHAFSVMHFVWSGVHTLGKIQQPKQLKSIVYMRAPQHGEVVQSKSCLPVLVVYYKVARVTVSYCSRDERYTVCMYWMRMIHATKEV